MLWDKCRKSLWFWKHSIFCLHTNYQTKCINVDLHKLHYANDRNRSDPVGFSYSQPKLDQIAWLLAKTKVTCLTLGWLKPRCSFNLLLYSLNHGNLMDFWLNSLSHNPISPQLFAKSGELAWGEFNNKKIICIVIMKCNVTCASHELQYYHHFLKATSLLIHMDFDLW